MSVPISAMSGASAINLNVTKTAAVVIDSGPQNTVRFWGWSAPVRVTGRGAADRRFRAVPCGDGRSDRYMGRAGLSH